MSKKDEAGKLDALARALFPDDDAISADEVGEFLDRVGCNRDTLRRRLREVAERLADLDRQRSVTPPPYLRAVIEALGEAGTLPSDPKAAAFAAAKWIQALRAKKPIPLTLQFLEAHRGRKGELSEAEKRVVEELKNELRNEIDEDDGKKE